MPRKLITITLLFSVLLAGKVCAQAVRFRHLTVDDGLSQNSAFSFAQDSLGFMWIGTSEGLNRYDGSSFRYYKYDPADSTSLSGNNIKSLLVRGSYLWVGIYGGGVNRLDLRTGHITHYFHDPKNKNSVCGDYVTCIRAIEDNLYIGTADGGACRLNPRTGVFTAITVLPAGIVRDICADRNGNVWFSVAGSGVTCWNPRSNEVKMYKADGKALNAANVRGLYADSRGWIWVSCWNGGFNVIEPLSGNVYSSLDTSSFIGRSLRTGLISSFLEDTKGNIWLCTAENGAIMYNPNTGEKKVFMNEEHDAWSMSDNTVFTAYEDRSHLIWLGTWRGGVNIYDPKTTRFGWFRNEPGDSSSLPNNYVYSFKLAHDGKIWIGTAAGVSIFNPETKKFTSVKPDPKDEFSIKSNSTVYAVEEDIDSTFWFGTSGGGLYHYYPATKKFDLYHPSGAPHKLPSSSPSVMTIGPHKELVVGTYGAGICVYDRQTKEFKNYAGDSANTHSISGNTVSALVNAPGGKIWVGTADGGLNLFDPVTGTFQRFLSDPKDSNSLAGSSVSNLCLDHHHNLWVGTESGLSRYDVATRHFFSYAKLHEFLKQEIVSIVEDDAGELWVTTRRGLGRLNPGDNSLRVFDVSDGLQSNEFLYKAFLRVPGGKIYLGGDYGFNCFLPPDIKDNPVPPRAVITGFTVLNHRYVLPEDISYTKQITLSYSDYFFSFRFAATEYSNNRKNQFKYKLEGFNTSWVEIGNSNTVTFTNLDPGEYTLQVLASNNSGLWNATPTELKIIITPPFWRTKWFYAFCFAMIVLSVYTYIRWREKKLVLEKTVLEEKVKQRTQELREEKEKVEAANKDIRDSINYARRIQTAILPQDEQFGKLLPESFVLFRPKDIVSGDFYWISQAGESIFYATADCTGHGVPGGFMTMLGTSLLNEIVNEKNITRPAAILDLLREKIIASLRQTGASGESKDGMDMVLARIDRGKNSLTYSAANNSLYVIRNGQLQEHKPDKQPIGFYGEELKPFTQHDLQLQPGDVIYTFTDGYADQFGGEKGKKFKYRQLEELLLQIHYKPMHEQKLILDNAIEQWKNGFEQVDDILVIGVRV